MGASARSASKAMKKSPSLAKVIPLRPRVLAKAGTITVLGVAIPTKAPKRASKTQQKAKRSVYARMLTKNAAPTTAELAAVRAQRGR